MDYQHLIVVFDWLLRGSVIVLALLPRVVYLIKRYGDAKIFS